MGWAAALLVTGLAAAKAEVQSDWSKPLGFPSPWGTGGQDWDSAYSQARAFVANLTLVEKVNLTTGTGWEADRCIGNTGSVPRIGFRAFCLEDGPVGVRYSEDKSIPNSLLPWQSWSDAVRSSSRSGRQLGLPGRR